MARFNLMPGSLLVLESTPAPAVLTNQRLVLGRNLTSCAHWMCLSPHLQARHPSCQARLLRLHHHQPPRHKRVSPVGGQMLVMHWHETTAQLHTPAVRHPKSNRVFDSNSVRSAFIDDPACSLLSPRRTDDATLRSWNSSERVDERRAQSIVCFAAPRAFHR